MAKKQIENYQPLVPQDLKSVFKKAKMRNFIGYLVCQWVHHSDYRALNSDWFFIPSNKMVEDTGLSKHTIMNYEAQLIDGGYIEKKAGNFATGKANEYFLTFKKNVGAFLTETAPIKKCTDNKNQIAKTAPINCTEGGIDNEEVNEKTAPINFEQNCTTDTDTEIDKETINIEKVVNYNTVLVSSSDSCEIETTDTNQPKELITDEKKPEEVLQQLTTFFTFDERFKSYNEKLLSKTPHYSINKQPSFEERGEGGKWFWSKWKTYSEWVKTSNISFEEVDQYNKTFLHLFTYYYKPKKLTNEKEKKFEEYKDNFMKQMKGVMHVYIFNRWKEFLANLDKYDNQTCKKFRYAFMEKADKWFKGEESYSDVCDMMDKEYFNSFVSTHKSNADITAVDQLFDAGYDLQEATEYLQATNLTSKQIKERWDELSTPSEEPLIKTRTERAVATVNLDAKPYDYGASGMAQ